MQDKIYSFLKTFNGKYSFLKVTAGLSFLLFSVTLLAVIIFNIGRYVLVASFADSVGNVKNSELISMFDVGIRLDLHLIIQLNAGAAVIAYLITAGCGRWFGRKRNFWSVISVFYAIILFLCLFSVILNYYYYRTYGNCIDVFFFNFFNEDLTALAATIYNGYPVFQILLFSLSAFAVFLFTVRLLARIAENLGERFSDKTNLMIALVSVMLIIISYRGGFGEMIRAKSVMFSSISGVKAVNEARSNPISLIQRNFKDYRESTKAINLSKLNKHLREYERLSRKYNLPVNKNNPLDSFYKTTRKNPYLEKHKPNVVFVLAESLSSHMSRFNSEEFNVLSSLKQHLDSDFYFRNFISETVATQKALVRLLFRAPYYMLPYNSMYAKYRYETFPFNAYMEQGYDVYFVTGTGCAWANMNFILKNNGVDNIRCSSDILKKYPEADNLYWGISDEYLYRYTYELVKNSEKPVAVFVLSTTNHPPYELPPSYSGHKELRFPEAVFEAFSKQTEDEVVNHYNTYRYAAETLGNFLSTIKNDVETADSTIVAFAGDHNARIGMYDYRYDPGLEAKGVLFSLYIPENYIRHDSINFDAMRVSSHKDIFPTLIEHSLSNQKYISLGCDLLSADYCPFDFGFNEDFILAADGVSDNHKNKKLSPEYDDYSKLLNLVFAIQIKNNMKNEE